MPQVSESRFRPARFSTGTDLVSVLDVADSVQRFGERYLNRLFTAGELEYCLRDDAVAAERLAARFAAKEATWKALGLGDTALPFREIEVVKTESGACELSLSGEALRVAEEAGFVAFSLSMSHEKDYALAIVLGERAVPLNEPRVFPQ